MFLSRVKNIEQKEQLRFIDKIVVQLFIPSVLFLFLLVKLEFCEVAFAEEIVVRQWITETVLTRGSLETEQTGKFAVAEQITDDVIKKKRFTNKLNSKKKIKEVDYGVYDIRIGKNTLNRSGNLFLSFLPKVGKYNEVIALKNYESIGDTSGLDVDKLDKNKSYVVGENGNLVEIDTKQYVVTEPPKKIVGNGWVVLSESESEKNKLKNTGIKEQPFNNINAIALKQPSSEPLFVYNENTEHTKNRGGGFLRQVVSASNANSSLYEVDSYLKDDANRSMGLFEKVHSKNNSVFDANGSNATGSLRGRVIIPESGKKSTIRIRIAGSNIEISANEDGFFNIPGFPIGANAEMLVWDSEGLFSRKLVPVTGDTGKTFYEIPLEPASLADELSRSFAVTQDMRLASFCGKINALSEESLISSKISVKSDKREYKVYFFDERGLPNRLLKEPRDSNKRLCVFNIDDELIDVNISLLNSERFSYTIHLKPTIFENNLTFDLTKEALYKKISPYELVDFDTALTAKQKEQSILFGAAGTRSWYAGHVSATWATASGMYISGDNAYSSVLFHENASNELYRFSINDEFVEVKWGINNTQNTGFTLVPRTYFGSIVEGADENIKVKMLDGISIDEMEQSTGEQVESSNGATFVSIDTSRLGVDYSGIRITVRDVWTGEGVGKISFVKPLPGSTSPKFVRFFVGNLKLGQHLLQVTDKAGAIKWFDVIRARPGLLQVISVD